jgi:RNA polymerase sigma-70 factor, ECF subfamily
MVHSGAQVLVGRGRRVGTSFAIGLAGRFDEMRSFVRSQVWPARTYPANADVREPHTSWLERFHAGDRAVLDEVYRGHVDVVHRSAGGVLDGADLETVVHEVFFRVMASGDLRKAFHGGDLAAWLVVVARNHAIDYVRRRNREQPAGLAVIGAPDVPSPGGASRAEAALLIHKFCAEVLPAKWRPVFEARFVQHLTQTEAAAALRMRRTTLVYQELRIRGLLNGFLLGEAA